MLLTFSCGLRGLRSNFLHLKAPKSSEVRLQGSRSPANLDFGARSLGLRANPKSMGAAAAWTSGIPEVQIRLQGSQSAANLDFGSRSPGLRT